ncbi:MAG: hypothetical protein ACOX0A_05055 [Thermoguttaceae bacterium]
MLRSLVLMSLVFSVWAPFLSVGAQSVFGQEVLFEDRFEGRLMPGWEWVRGNAPSRRFVNDSLEILTEPFAYDEARNALVRPLNFFRWRNGCACGSYRIETECYFLEKPAPNQQCGVFWIQNRKVLFKLVFANVDGKMYVFPGKVPVETAGGRLRLTVTGRNIVTEFCSLNDTEFRRVYEGRIDCTPNDRISLQCWGAPLDGATVGGATGPWARFRYFRVEKLDE